ncbi:MAG: 16S rRNA (cytosine(967)-C(5))-methyltransferase RsmB [Clostridia bacterium]|nr:16S rRNA (cytosine(967)-C(5))-methyltransferase RsmB [Clostridia bacterium]
MTENNKQSARFAAYSSLLRCEKDKRYSNLEIDSTIRRFGLEGAERGLYTTLVYGVIERRITLDYFLSRFSAKPLDTLDPEVLTLLRLGLYQLIYLDRIPESAAVNESVILAKRVKPRAASFVNAVLRGFLRGMGRKKLEYPDESNLLHYFSVRYSCSEDVIQALIRSVENVGELLEAMSVQPDVTLRVNTLKITRDALMDKLREAGVEAVPTSISPFGVRLTGKTLPESVSALIASGEVFVQDEASQLAVMAADPCPGQTVIDTCACPGGKSFSAAMLMENRGRIMSFDLHKNKLSLVESGAAKMGISILTVAEKNGMVPDETLYESADVVICDAPCSGLGVIAKKPEIRYKSSSDICGLPMTQLSILKVAARYVKVGGTLCYTTCTLNKDENERVVESFLRETSDYTYAPAGFNLGELSFPDGQCMLLPHIHGTDGFFIAKFTRIK